MKKTEIAVDIFSSFGKKITGNVVFENEDAFLEAEYLCCDSGILVLRAYEDNIEPKQVIELLAGCAKDPSVLEEILKEKDVIESWEEITGVVMSVSGIPVLATHYNYAPEKLYAEWNRQKKAKDENGNKGYFDASYFG